MSRRYATIFGHFISKPVPRAGISGPIDKKEITLSSNRFLWPATANTGRGSYARAPAAEALMPDAGPPGLRGLAAARDLRNQQLVTSAAERINGSHLITLSL